MLKIDPIPRAFVPVNSDAARAVAAHNYDEFGNDVEVWHALERTPNSVLKIAMAHCAVPDVNAIGEDGSDATLARARTNLIELATSALLRPVENLLYVYEIERGSHSQIGVSGLAKTAQIRTDERPDGVIQRNEAIRPKKAASRARVTEGTGADLGVVNLSVEDAEGHVLSTLREIAGSRPADFEAPGPAGPSIDGPPDGSTHRVWLVTQPDEIDMLQSVLGRESEAYVADGNHRSAAADHLGLDGFLAVFFPASTLRIEPYHRVMMADALPTNWKDRVAERFDVHAPTETPVLPGEPHTIGLYDGEWHSLVLKDEHRTEDPVDSISAAICQQNLFEGSFGIESPIDPKIDFIGGTRPISEMTDAVDRGEISTAITLAPVTMPEFIEVCRARAFMPAKSTWFDPKILTGLVTALTPLAPAELSESEDA